MNNKTPYSEYILQNNLPSRCLDQNIGSDRTSGIRPSDIATSSILSGRGSDLYKEVATPSQVIPDFTRECTLDGKIVSGYFSKTDRNVRVNKMTSEKETLGYNMSILPFDVQSQYRTFDYINSRQIVKDIKEQMQKK